MCCSSGESELKFGNKKLDRGMKAEDICQKITKMCLLICLRFI